MSAVAVCAPDVTWTWPRAFAVTAFPFANCSPIVRAVTLRSGSSAEAGDPVSVKLVSAPWASKKNAASSPA